MNIILKREREVNLNIFIAFLITVAIIALVARLYVLNDKKIQFFAKGLDSNFKFAEISTLWKLSKKAKLENPISLYVSLNEFNNCILKYIEDEKAKGTDKSYQTQQFLTKLYDYRTRIALDTDGKRGLESTKSLNVGQRLRIILPGKGVFSAKLLSNGRELVVTRPVQEDKKNHRFHMPECEMWIGHSVSIYFWRKGDAGYAFDTTVFEAGIFQGHDCLFMRHSDKLDRIQKRQSIRCECNVYAQMYMIKNAVVDYNSVNTEEGYRCLLEDISEDGALIRIGGMGKANVQIKLQFTLNDTFIMMYGVIRAVEYNKEIEQSRLHFECTHIDPAMKNAVLSYVYAVIPQDQKEKSEAIRESENDSKEEAQIPQQSAEEIVRSAEKNVEDASKTVQHAQEAESQKNQEEQPQEHQEEEKTDADGGSTYFGMGGVGAFNPNDVIRPEGSVSDYLARK